MQLLCLLILQYSEQDELKKKLIENDSDEVNGWKSQDGSDSFRYLKRIGGVDISFDKAKPDRACAIISILKYPSLEVQTTPLCN